MMRHTYTITGMTCQGCRSHVEQALKEVAGVTDVKVDLEKGQAEIEMEQQIPLQSFQEKLAANNSRYSINFSSTGETEQHPVPMKHIYQVTGMSCNGCRSHVERSLSEIPGVTRVEVDLEKKLAEIEMEYHISLHKFQEKLAEEGDRYQIDLLQNELHHEDQSPMKHVYSVFGMTCNGCRSHVEKTIKEVPGVLEVEVDLERGQAEISMENHIPLKTFQGKLEADGGSYSIRMPGDKPQPRKKAASTGSGVFYCPMHCEGEKTYDKPGDCPVCGMDLIEAPSAVKIPAQYTCPMHPEIVQDEPGSCPICGMDLVPLEAGVEEEDGTYKKLLRKFKIAVAFTLPIFIIAMSEMIPGNPLEGLMAYEYWNWIQLALSIPVVFYATWMFFERAYRSIKTWNLNMFTLIGIGAGVAWLFSVGGMLFPSFFPEQFKTHHGTVHVYFEAATVILSLVLMGQLLEAKAHGRTNSAIKELLKLAPNQATRIVNGKDQIVAIDQIQKGDLLRVKPGEKIPVDGRITEGESHIDESMISGEPVPVTKGKSDAVTAGTLNGNKTFVMTAEKVGSETLLSQIIEMVNSASRSRAPIQKVADRISGYFVPIVVLTAVITFVIWAVFGPEPSYVYALVNAIAVLIIACPCALGLATPMSVMVGVGKGAQAGVLIKNAESLEKMNEMDVVVIDKTGTVTEGKPSVEKVVSVSSDLSERKLLHKIASLNSSSEHPLAQATLKYAEKEKVEVSEVSGFESVTGKGVMGALDGKPVALGNEKLMAQMEAAISAELQEKVSGEQLQGKTVSFLAEGSKVLGYVVISDKIKETSKKAIQELQRQGVEVIMFTGDNEKTARSVSAFLGLDGFRAQMLPQDKLEEVKKLQQQGKKVAMAGDGINDAPALAQADIGIAMGTGTDVAIESAGITLVKGDMMGIAKARELSRMVMRNIKQNLFFALAYNILGIPIAAGVLFPAFGMLLSPMIAALAMSFSSVSVIGNALRLRAQEI